MKIRIIFLCIFLFTAILSAQKPKEFLDLKSRYGFNVQRMAPVSFNIFFEQPPFSEQPQAYLAAAIQNDVLQYVKKGNEYFAEYQINLAVRNEKRTIYTSSWTEKTKASDFKETNSRRKFQRKNYHLTNLQITPEEFASEGKYVCHLEVHDIISRSTQKLKQEIILSPAETDSIRISPITFIEDLPDSTGYLKLTPLKNFMEYNKPSFAFAQLIHQEKDSAAVEAELHKKQGNDFVTIAKQFLKIKTGPTAANIVYPLPYKKMDEGTYSLEFKLGSKTVKKDFNVIWFTKPIYLYKTDLALRPLRYVLSPAEFDSVKGLDLDKMELWFSDFWKQQDQTKETQYNELLSEFYNRVDYANRYYSVRSREGWETDRGRIYLLYGEPEKVENRRYAANSLPYLIWTYPDDLTFVFVDKSKNGEFFLIETEEED